MGVRISEPMSASGFLVSPSADLRDASQRWHGDRAVGPWPPPSNGARSRCADARPATPTQGHSGTKMIALVPIVK
jgi:hypothetical protein